MTLNNRGAEAVGRGDAQRSDGRAKPRVARPRSKPKPHLYDQPLSAKAYLAAGGVLLFVSVALLLVYIYTAPLLREQGIEERVYSILLLTVWLLFVVATFGVMRSGASYEGTNLRGALKLEGPLVALLLFVLIGPQLTGSPDRISVVVHLLDENGRPVVGKGLVTLRYGQDSRTAQVGPAGESKFEDVDRKYANKQAEVIIAVEGYEMIGETTVTLAPVIHVMMKRLGEVDAGRSMSDREWRSPGVTEVKLAGARRSVCGTQEARTNSNPSSDIRGSEISEFGHATPPLPFAPTSVVGCTAEMIRLRRC
jgi:hypothetical protein